jgi:Tfp pilus assembly protein PilN
MSTLTARDTTTRLATLPRVNLLPPEIGERRRFKRVQAGLGVGVVAAVGIVGLLALVANSQVSSAQDKLDTAKAQQTALQGTVAEYAEVPLVFAQVDAREAQLTQAMGKEVRWSYFLNDLSLSVPSKVWLTEMSMKQNVDDAALVAATPADTGYLQPGLATLSFTGKGFTHNDVAAWLDALSKQRGLSQPYFTSSIKEPVGTKDSVTFSSSATVTDEALSKRWTQKAGS